MRERSLVRGASRRAGGAGENSALFTILLRAFEAGHHRKQNRQKGQRQPEQQLPDQ